MRDKLFYANPELGFTVQYGDLLRDMASAAWNSQYCYSQDYYAIFKAILLSIIADRPITLLDSDFSADEVRRLTGIGDISSAKKYSVICPKLSSPAQLLERVKQCRRWSVTLYTSGTTGRPKKVNHSFQTLNRKLKISPDHSGDVWGFAYNPTHIAGLQVFFQALMNLNPIVRLFALRQSLVSKAILKHRVTHLSATPTFYKLFEPNDVFFGVKRVTAGGEKLDDAAAGVMSKVFPNAKVLNVYASTEAGTVLASEGGVFTVPVNFMGEVKVQNGELVLHASLLGKSSDLKLKKGWYYTGDMVEVLTENPLSFKFLSRKSELISVGGYKVNPQEVEEALCALPQVIDARVYSQKNSVLGSVVCAEIVSNSRKLTIPVINKALRTSLQEHKIPRIYNFVESLKSTRTGKKERK